MSKKVRIPKEIPGLRQNRNLVLKKVKDSSQQGLSVACSTCLGTGKFQNAQGKDCTSCSGEGTCSLERSTRRVCTYLDDVRFKWKNRTYCLTQAKSFSHLSEVLNSKGLVRAAEYAK